MRFVRCKTTRPYEAMILTPEQAYAVLLNRKNRSVPSRSLPRARASAYQNAWACNGKTSVSLTL
jgi:hypothetical protein